MKSTISGNQRGVVLEGIGEGCYTPVFLVGALPASGGCI